MATLFTNSTSVQKTTNFFDCVKLIRFVARIYGLLSFSIDYTPNREIENCQLRVFDVFYAVMHIILCLVSSVLTFMYFTTPKNIWAMVLVFGMEFFLISAILLAAVSIALDILNRNRLIAMLQKINLFDKQVN